MAAVILGLDKAVELAVVHLLQLVALLLGQVGEIFRKALTDFLNLRIGKLYLLHVRPFQVVTVGIGADTFLDVGGGVVEGMLQQGYAVVVLILAAHAVFLADLQVVAVLGLQGVLVDVLGIVYLHLRVEEPADVFLIVFRRNPPLTELQADVVEGYLLGQGLLQCLFGFLQGRYYLRVIGMFLSHFEGIIHVGKFLVDITGEYLGADFIAPVGHIVYLSFQVVRQLLSCLARQTGHIFKVHRAVSVQRGEEGILRSVRMVYLIGHERHGTLKDVGLHELPALGILDGQHVTAFTVVHDQPGIPALVQVAELLHELVIDLVQLFTQFRLFMSGLCLRVIQLLVGITNLIVQFHPLLIKRLDLGLFCYLGLFWGNGNAFSFCFLLIPHRKEVELHRGLIMVLDFYVFTLLFHRLYCLLWRNSLTMHLCLLLYRIYLFLIRGDLFFLDFGCIGLIVFHKVTVQVTFQILRQQSGDAFHPAIV